MSMSYSVFLSDIDDSKIEEWILELNKLGMNCEIHPEFSFKDHSGFLPFKIIIKENTHDLLLNNEYLTGFEFYLDAFDVEEHKPQIKQNFFEKLFKKPISKGFYHSAEIDEKLKDKKVSILFNFGIADTFEMRMASLCSAILSKVCDGLCRFDDDDSWYDNSSATETLLKEVSDYEKSLKQREFRVHKFEGWQ